MRQIVVAISRQRCNSHVPGRSLSQYRVIKRRIQRLPRVIGDGAAREWIFTGGDYSAQRAREVQLLNDVLPDPPALDAATMAAR